MPFSSFLHPTLHALQIAAPSTNVGKTIFSTLLALTHRRIFPGEPLHYLKPISTGPSKSSDFSHLSQFAGNLLDTNTTLFQYDEPKSPHLVAIDPPPDTQIRAKIIEHLHGLASPKQNGTLFLETAGGVHSPGLRGISQADLYRPLRLPVVLIGDSKLGGISTTISAFESLKIRGYDVDAVMIFRNCYYQNDGYLKDYFGKEWGIKTAVVEPPPKLPEEDDTQGEYNDVKAMETYYIQTSENEEIAMILRELKIRHQLRVERLHSLAPIAQDKIWYPFTQQMGMQPTDITTIDSAYGDHFQTLSSVSSSPDSLLTPMFDGSASWWTQGLGHGNPKLSLCAAYAAGRYGHVMFAGAAHEPAISLAELMLSSIANPRFSRVFYSDNGSTGCEVAVKMALRAVRKRYGWNREDGKEIEILGLKGAYHGDTIGAMDCANPGAFNNEVDWYKGRGYWFDSPTIGCSKGKWRITIPKEIEQFIHKSKNDECKMDFTDINDIFNLSHRKSSALGTIYEEYILSTLAGLSGRRFGALMLEPVVLGAGGMLFIDPLFQHILTTTVRSNPALFSQSCENLTTKNTTWAGLPVIADEVFTGLYRLGHFSSSSLIQIQPDISIYAKLLTGGVIPLSITLSSESIFEAFLSSEKKDALLHGHSYTAHAVGCQVACASVEILKKLAEDGTWKRAKEDWSAHNATFGNNSNGIDNSLPKLWSVFSKSFVTEVSHHPNVSSVWALGSVFAAHLKEEGSKGGYLSNAALGFLKKLKEMEDFKVHARALGNVVYIMTAQTTSWEEVKKLEMVILKALQ